MNEITRNHERLINDVKQIVEQGRQTAYQAVDRSMVDTYWKIGRRIVEEEQQGQSRAAYGKQIIKMLSEELTREYGSGFSQRYLAYFRQFYVMIPDITILQTRLQNLRWSHILSALTVDDPVALRWYLETASEEMWSVRALARNISTQYYERHYQQPQLPSQAHGEADKNEIIKNPLIAEFLGFKQNDSLSENELESAIIDHLQDFLLELGRGFAFMGRQQHIRTAAEDYYIDLVFYNVYLKCYVLIDLKVGKITHQDVGQMDMYVRMYDELKRKPDDNPTIGILLCSQTDKDIARYSILKGNEQIFATKYKLYLPTEEELRNEIEHQKQLFHIQQNK